MGNSIPGCVAAVVVMMVSALAAQEPASKSSVSAPARGDTRRIECLGERVTQVVEAGEYWAGTHERDVVAIIGNGAEVWTNLGDDVVCVYGGAPDRYGHGSTVVSGAGNNRIITYAGSNYIRVGAGTNFIYLNGDEEEVEGSWGNDHIWALGATRARIYGDDGDDVIVGSPGPDWLDGGTGDDLIIGAAGDDTITADFGNDFVFGGAGSDDIDAGAGIDTCVDTPGGAVLTSCEEEPVDPGLPESS